MNKTERLLLSSFYVFIHVEKWILKEGMQSHVFERVEFGLPCWSPGFDSWDFLSGLCYILVCSLFSFPEESSISWFKYKLGTAIC